MPFKINPSTVKGPDRYLSNFSLQIAQSNSVFKAANILPVVPVAKDSGIYRVWNAESLRKVAVQPLAEATVTAAGDMDFDEGQYYTRTYGLHVDYGAETKANAADDLALGEMATEYLTTQMLMKMETSWYDSMFKSGVWGADKVGGTDFVKFDDASSDPIGVIKSAITQQQILSGGVRPNVLVLTRQVMDAVEQHPEIIDRINRGQTTGPAIASEQNIASLFGLSRVVVLEAVMQDDTGANAFLGGNHMLLMYLNPTAGMRSMTAAVSFKWRALGEYMTLGANIRQFDLGPVIEGATRYEAKDNWQFAITAPVLGTFFQDVI